jgi:hypothetical protein
MVDVNTIVVGSRELLAPLQARPGITGGAVTVFPTDDIRAALETILAAHPRYLVLDHEFSQSPRGAAMIGRLQADPGFEATEVLVVRGSAVALLAVAGTGLPPEALDWRGTRRVPRIRIRTGIQAQVDGSTADLVDLSTLGAQVVSGAALKPNQRVRFSLPADAGERLVATVAWANFELPKGKPSPQYRAGLQFNGAAAGPLEQFCQFHAVNESDARQ